MSNTCQRDTSTDTQLNAIGIWIMLYDCSNFNYRQIRWFKFLIERLTCILLCIDWTWLMVYILRRAAVVLYHSLFLVDVCHCLKIFNVITKEVQRTSWISAWERYTLTTIVFMCIGRMSVWCSRCDVIRVVFGSCVVP